MFDLLSSNEYLHYSLKPTTYRPWIGYLSISSEPHNSYTFISMLKYLSPLPNAISIHCDTPYGSSISQWTITCKNLYLLCIKIFTALHENFCILGFDNANNQESGEIAVSRIDSNQLGIQPINKTVFFTISTHKR